MYAKKSNKQFQTLPWPISNGGTVVLRRASKFHWNKAVQFQSHQGETQLSIYISHQEQINCCFTITQPTHKFLITHSHHSSFSLHSKQHNTAVKLPGSCWNCHKSVGDSYYIYFKADRKVSGGIAATRQICRQGDGAARSGCPSL